MTIKGKEVAGKDSSGKRKRSDGDDKSGGGRKTRNRGVLQFFEDAAEAGDTDDSFDSDFSDGIEMLIPLSSDRTFCLLPRLLPELLGF